MLKTIKPFIKWAGGKSQLLGEIRKRYPEKIERYCEPFIGGGAVLFDVLANFKPKEVLINDINCELINTYIQIRDNVEIVILLLSKMQEIFWAMDSEQRKEYFYSRRDRFNELIQQPQGTAEKAALFIFLNKTCFNGLYRVNQKGKFNVPIGAYKKPAICDEDNLYNASRLLSNVQITCGDYSLCRDFINYNTFVYIDPPYRPLTTTAAFTSYNNIEFGDKQQIELGKFIEEMTVFGAKIVASNSDPKNIDKNDNFFDDIYKSFIISRVSAPRIINSIGSGRGAISELLICNFKGRNMKRNFTEWLSKFRSSIADYGYYTDFEKVHKNVNNIKVELNILNSLIGSKNIEKDFIALVDRYPETLKCIPLLLAVRMNEIYVVDSEGDFNYNFKKMNYSVKQYAVFMRKTGLFNLLENHILSNLIDYATGVETGLDSNGRKNRGGHLMENLVENYIQKAGFIKNKDYFKEMYIHEITDKWGIDLSAISNQGKMEKRFDFVIKTSSIVYGIETNFYASGGSKLNETARSYKQIAQESETIKGFTFVWFTDGKGWNSAKHNLEETFDIMDNIYSIDDLEHGVINRLK